MARRRKELPIINAATISDVAAEGQSIAKVDDFVIFIPYGAPGDVVDIKIDRKKKRYAEGHIERMIEPSTLRVDPRCVHFGTCGGCRWQHLPYDYQLECKQRQVADALQRIGKIELPAISPILGSEKIWEYRNKMEYTFSNKKWLTFDQLRSGEEFPDRDAAGFHIPGAFDKVLDIEECHLQDHLGDRIRLFIKGWGKEHGATFYDLREQHGLLRTLMVRIASTGQVMVVMAFGEDDGEKIASLMNAIKDTFPEITSLHYVVNTKCNDSFADLDITLFSGTPYIEEQMGDLKFRIAPKSFYQTNSLQAKRLYDVVKDFAGLSGSELVYDLYTGTGTIANYLARDASHVIGIEYVEDAIRDAWINSEANGISNTEFYAGDMKDVLTDDFIKAHGAPQVMVVDPPRAGMHEDVVGVILRARPEKIVYVSCNPATQARDLELLDGEYKVVAVQPVDMFPHTHHVENVVKLIRRDLL
ncbi:MAG: 23S rRNA (uracil(1939)-C(5))-methyltransferase RlmD [Paramuribaculum sp.]|nr:23S rRNA (uracil(1939)-C(5))-methyltransferase RlmD [Paramuribaculum sp.]